MKGKRLQLYYTMYTLYVRGTSSYPGNEGDGGDAMGVDFGIGFWKGENGMENTDLYGRTRNRNNYT